MRTFGKVGVGLGGLVASAASMAAVNVTPIETAISDAGTAAAAVASAVLLVIVGVAVYKWIKRAL